MFKINDLKNCVVLILDHTSQMTIDRCEDCTFILGPIKNSIFVRDSQNCQITVSCGQFRCRTLFDSSIKLYCPQEPVVESSSGLTLSPYNLKWSQLEEFSQAAELIGEFTDEEGATHQKINHWKEVHDFTPAEEGSNFELIAQDDFQVVNFSAIADEH